MRRLEVSLTLSRPTDGVLNYFLLFTSVLLRVNYRESDFKKKKICDLGQNYLQTISSRELSLVNMVRGDFNKFENLGIFLYNSRFLFSFLCNCKPF